jgi:hypothetical protein
MLYNSKGFDKSEMTFIQHYSITQKSFTALKMPHAQSIHPPFIHQTSGNQ